MSRVNDVVQRGDDRLQALYESVEQGVPVDWKRLALLADIEQVQLGRAVYRRGDRTATASRQPHRTVDEADNLTASDLPVGLHRPLAFQTEN